MEPKIIVIDSVPPTMESVSVGDYFCFPFRRDVFRVTAIHQDPFRVDYVRLADNQMYQDPQPACEVKLLRLVSAEFTPA